MLSALLTGVNRAFPYAKGIKQQSYCCGLVIKVCGLLDENGRSIEILLQHSPLCLETDTVKAFSVEKEVHLY